MFTRLTLRTVEAGLMVIYRLPDNSGGLGDIIATDEGVLVNGHFDLKTEEDYSVFLDVLRRAQRMVKDLGEGIPPPDEYDHAVEREIDATRTHEPSVVHRHLKAGEPLHIGHRSVHPNTRFSTVCMKVTDAGGLEPHCALCLVQVRAQDKGWFILQQHVRSIGLYESPEKDTIFQASTDKIPVLTTWGQALKDNQDKEGLWIHDCSPIEQASCLLGFKIPDVMRREDVVEE